MWAFLQGIAKAIGLADFLAKWSKQESDQTTGGELNAAAGLQAQATTKIEEQANAESVHRLSVDELNQRLRARTGRN